MPKISSLDMVLSLGCTVKAHLRRIYRHISSAETWSILYLFTQGGLVSEMSNETVASFLGVFQPCGGLCVERGVHIIIIFDVEK